MATWLTLDEAAQYMKMGRSTLYKLVQTGKVPGYKAGRSWRFAATELDAWLRGEIDTNSRLDIAKIRTILSDHRQELESGYGIEKIGLFGSYVRGQARPDSDVDIMVHFRQKIGFFRFLELEEHLGEWLHATVDLVSRDALKPRIGRNILSEVVWI